MKSFKYTNKIFSLLMIIFLIVPSVIPVNLAYAQTTTGSGSNATGSSNSGSGSFAGNIGGIGATVINCTPVGGLLGGALQSVGGAIGGAVGGLFGGGGEGGGQSGSSLGGSGKVPVTNSALEIKTTSLEKKEKCLDGITHEIVVQIMDKITLSTVDWINGGFEGDPFYVTNTEEFLTDLAVGEINGITKWYGTNIEDYPFGQILMETLISDIRRSSQQRLRSSLNDVLAHGTRDEFSASFNVGGWSGYTAYYRQNNNPFGSYLALNSLTSKKIRGTGINATLDLRQQLDQAGGFLSQRRCALTETGNPNDPYYGDDPDLNLSQYQPYPEDQTVPFLGVLNTLSTAAYAIVVDGGPLSEETARYNKLIAQSHCKTWKTITPGKVIADKLTTALDNPDKQLQLADEFNENLALIFDALLNQLIEEGLSYFSVQNNTSTNNVLFDQVQGGTPGQLQNQSPLIDLLNGLNGQQSLIDIQNDYLDNVGPQALDNLNEIIWEIRTLDFCVPGPNPIWVQDAQIIYQNYLNSVPVYTASANNPQIANLQMIAHYKILTQDILGVRIANSDDINSHSKFLAFMSNTFVQYVNFMLNEYSQTGFPPTSRSVATGFFYDMVDYQAKINEITSQMQSIDNSMGILLDIQTVLSGLLYEDAIDPSNDIVHDQLVLFNSISGDFVNAEQVAELLNYSAIVSATTDTVIIHIGVCTDETLINASAYEIDNPNERAEYRYPINEIINNYIETAFNNAGDSFLPGVDFGENDTNTEINIESGGINVTNSGSVSQFENILHNVLY